MPNQELICREGSSALNVHDLYDLFAVCRFVLRRSVLNLNGPSQAKIIGISCCGHMGEPPIASNHTLPQVDAGRDGVIGKSRPS